MNNTPEAEKYLKEVRGYAFEQVFYRGELISFMEAYHQFAREKELASLTDEVIEEITSKNLPELYLTARTRAIDGAKALRDYLKQNNTQFTSELNDVFKEAIYELWMYSGGEDQSSEIRKKLEKYHKITGMPWPEGELKYKPK